MSQDYKALQNRLEALKDYKAEKLAEVKSNQEQLRDLKEKVQQDYGIGLDALQEYAAQEEARFEREMQEFEADLNAAEKIRAEIETQVL